MQTQFSLQYKYDSAIKCYLYVWICPVCLTDNREPRTDVYTTRHECCHCKTLSGHLKDESFAGITDSWNREIQKIIQVPKSYYQGLKAQTELNFK